MQASIVATVGIAVLGSWALMKPPNAGLERLATGEIVGPVATVARAAPTATILLAPEVPERGSLMLDQTVAAILNGLGFPDETQDAATLHHASVARVNPAVAANVEGLPLVELIVEAITARTDDASIDAMVNTAAANGDITVLAALMTTDGVFDTPVLLASVVLGAQMRLGEAPAERAPSNAIYTVAAGDSLAGIAHKIFGNASDYPKLMAANSAILSSPADVVVGMQLLVPTSAE